MIETYKAAPDIDVLTGALPVPGLGVVPVNAFVLQGSEPLLVDTGAVVHKDAFLSALDTVIDRSSLRWIWLTHPDPDHIGALQTLLRDNPHCRVITTFLAMGMMSLHSPLPIDRVHLLNPGEVLEVGHRSLLAVKPPTFDNPATTGFFDRSSRTLFSADCFGAVLDEPPQDAAELSEAQLRDGQTLWTSIDAPWLHQVDRGLLARELDRYRRLDPALVLSSHLPKASGKAMSLMLQSLASVPDAQPFVGPNQPALEAMLLAAAQ